MKTTSSRPLLVLIVVFALFAQAPLARAQTVIAQWNFNESLTAPSTGAGALAVLGGVATSTVSGAGSTDPATTPDNALNTANYPAQGAGARTAGVEIRVSTTGYEAISFSFDFRASNTANRRVQVLYSTDGGATFVDGPAYAITAGGVFTNGLGLSLSGVPAANNLPVLVLRVVSDTDNGNYQAVTGSYSPAGTWRFDMVTVTGTPGGGAPVGPTVVSQPQSRTHYFGSTATFNVTASGTPPLFYQWLAGDLPIPGATGSSLVLTNVQAAAAGPYRVTISNAVAAVTSEPAVLTLVEDPGDTLRDILSLKSVADGLNNTNNVETTDLFLVEGVVTTHVNLTGPPNHLLYLQDATAGIALFWRNATFNPRAGDRLRVKAPLTFFNGLRQLYPNGSASTHQVTLLSTNHPLPAPRPFTLEIPADFNAVEAVEGSRIQVDNVTVDQATGTTFLSGSNVPLTDALGQKLDLRVDARVLDVIGQPRPTTPVSVVGVLGQFDTANPRDTGYQLLVTRYADLISAVKPPSVAFTNYLGGLVRPGDLVVNTFREQVLRPGESLRLEVVVTDPENRPVTVQPLAGQPAGAGWNFPALSGTNLTGTLTFTAPVEAAGQLLTVGFDAVNHVATNAARWTIHVPSAAEQQLMLTEFYANPTSSVDAPHFNPLARTEVPSSSITLNDEFIELVNLGPAELNLLNWSIADSLNVRHRFYAPTTLVSSNAAVIYGGPLNGNAPTLPAGVYQEPASEGSGVALNNDGDLIVIRNAQSNLVLRVSYPGSSLGTNSSLARFPNTDGPFQPHRTINDRHWSPGLQPDGRAWTESQAGVAPQPPFGVAASLDASGRLVLAWPVVQGRTYTVKRAATLGGGYSPVATGLASGTYTAETAGDGGFFRVETP